jgi:hypothetical protein
LWDESAIAIERAISPRAHQNKGAKHDAAR